jgi:hypothetical protein
MTAADVPLLVVELAAEDLYFALEVQVVKIQGERWVRFLFSPNARTLNLSEPEQRPAPVGRHP